MQDTTVTLTLIDAGDWIGKQPQPRRFLDGDTRLVPMRNVTLLGGDGGVGKSLLALQLALACSTAIPDWIGIEVPEESVGPVIYLSAEDDEHEVHRRVREICEATPGANFEAIRGRLLVLDMTGLDATLGAEKANSGVVSATKVYHALDRLMDDKAPVLLIIDNLADAYSGNENSRSPVKHFVGLLRRLAIKHDCAVLMLGHPSLMGMSSGTGASGSTAWNNSVRSRLYLKTQTNGDGDGLVLEAMKANYGPKGKQINLRWFGGRLVPSKSEPKVADHLTHDTQHIVAAEAGKGDWRSEPKAERWFGYWLADHLDVDIGEGLTAKQRTDAHGRARVEIINLLKQFEKGGVIHKVVKADGRYEKRSFYEAGRAKEERA